MIRRTLMLLAIGVLLLLFGITACNNDWFLLPTATPAPPTLTQTVTPSPTTTRVWFPATATNTPSPNNAMRTATPDLRPVDNEILLSEDFSDQTHWEQVMLPNMTAAFGINELTLSIKEEKGTLYSFYTQPIPADYYLEMLIEPNLCSGEDSYGFLFRTQSKQEFYRLMLGCDGNIRLDQVRGSSSVRLAETTQSAQIFSSPMSQIRLNIWLVEDGVQVFINDVLQVEYYRVEWLSGAIGVFARSSGEKSLSVSYRDLGLRAVNPLPPTPVPSPTATPK